MLKKENFTRFVVKYNHLDETGFEEWAFYAGMLFNSPEKWWGDGGNRTSPHEGLDICFYRNKKGNLLHLDETAKIPAMYDGEIVKIGDDFLGKSVYMRHPVFDGRGNQLYTAYGHTAPCDISVGTIVKEGDIVVRIGKITKKTPLIPHLHISAAWIPVLYPPEQLDWAALGDCSISVLLDPLDILSCKYKML
jgi:murein DD-endopeptidase MepM/ murein hydrolase activator NlpD